MPELPLRRLQTLYLAHNELASIPPEMASNLTSLHYLDLSANDLTVVPLITHTLPELKTFNLADNPITAVTNTSFLGIADSLEELDIRRLSLLTFEVSFLHRKNLNTIVKLNYKIKILYFFSIEIKFNRAEHFVKLRNFVSYI